MSFVLYDRIETKKIEQAIAMLKVIAHPVRISIVDLLTTHKRLQVMEIQEMLDLEQAVASHHLTLMEAKGVLHTEREGRKKFVSLRYPKMKNIVACLESCCNNS